MSNGSYFTIYRKNAKDTLPANRLAVLKEEYFKANQNCLVGSSSTVSDDELRDDLPMFMQVGYKACNVNDSHSSYVYCDKDGIMHDKLLEFHFTSSFRCLKEAFGLSPYKFKTSSTIIPVLEAEKMLQAIEYILSEDYSRKFENVLKNAYVPMFGAGFSPFDKRFKQNRDPIYIDKEGQDYKVQFYDSCLDDETDENDDAIRISLNRVKVCLLAYLDAERWNDDTLVLEYSVY